MLLALVSYKIFYFHSSCILFVQLSYFSDQLLLKFSILQNGCWQKRCLLIQITFPPFIFPAEQQVSRHKHLFHRDLHFVRVSSHPQIQRVKSERRIKLLKELGLWGLNWHAENDWMERVLNCSILEPFYLRIHCCEKIISSC